MKLIDVSPPGARPVFENLPEINRDATGLFTPIDLDAPNAVDPQGRPVLVSLSDGSFRLRPGVHVIYWEATDPITNTTRLAGQRINIFLKLNSASMLNFLKARMREWKFTSMDHHRRIL